MIDTHSHIDMLNNPDESIKDSFDSGVEYIIVPSASNENFEAVISLCNYHDKIYGALGVHPEDVSKFNKSVEKEIYKLALENKKISAIGEIGLDYYWDRTEIEKQKEIFKTQIEIALSLDLPILVHSRESNNDAFEIMKNAGVKKAILHCFSGGVDFAEKCINEGWLLGIGGVVTFKNSRKIKEVVKEIPLEYLVLETDAPYLTPHPFRGEENSPKYLKFIAKEIANIKDTTFENVDIITTRNAKEFFKLD